jgi:hypothetical protein
MAIKNLCELKNSAIINRTLSQRGVFPLRTIMMKQSNNKVGIVTIQDKYFFAIH